MSRPLRIVVLHSRYLSGPASGENRVVDDEVRLLRDGGHHVEVWDPEPKELAGLGLVKTGIRSLWSSEAARRAADMVHRHEPDIVHVHNLFPMLSPSVIRSAMGGPAVVMTLHNYRLMCLPGLLLRDGRVCEDCVGRVPWPGVVHRCYRGSTLGSAALAGSLALHRAIRTFGLVDRYLAISSFVKDKHVQAGFSPRSIRVKTHFAWPVARREGPGDYFLYLGRLSPEKGMATIVESWREDLGVLVVAGDGPEGPRLKRSAGANVRFLGPVEASDVPALLSRTRAVMAPSTCYEGAGKAVLEGYAAGVPAVASSIGGLPEAVEDGVTGLLAPAGDRRAWTEAAERLLDDAESERMGEAAWQRWSERYSPEQGLRDLEDSYEDAIEAHGGIHANGDEDAWPRATGQ